MLNIFQRIIVHIIDPSADLQPTVAAALAMIKDRDAHITLFHPLCHRSLFDRAASDDDMLREARELLLSDRSAKLAAIAATLPAETECVALWSSDGWLDLTRRANDSRPDLVISETRPKSRWQRLRLGNDDWQLIRYCPAALMLVKSDREVAYRRVVAAIDPLHADDKPASLDHTILTAAARLCRQLKTELTVVNYVPPMLSGAPTVTEPLLAADTSVMAAAVAAHRQRVAELMVEYRLTDAQSIIEIGDPADEIVAQCRDCPDSILVMGAVARSALGRFLIGNTAEKVLDEVPCDLLIVKPERTTVTSAI